MTLGGRDDELFTIRDGNEVVQAVGVEQPKELSCGNVGGVRPGDLSLHRPTAGPAPATDSANGVAAARAGRVASAVRVDFYPQPDPASASYLVADSSSWRIAVPGECDLRQRLICFPVRVG